MKKFSLVIALALSVTLLFSGCGILDTVKQVYEANNVQETTVASVDPGSVIQDETSNIPVVIPETTSQVITQPIQTTGAVTDLTINGTVITYPYTYEKIKAAGFDFREVEKADYVLNPYYSSSGVSMVNASGQRIVVGFANYTDNMLTYKECEIDYISASTMLEDNPNIVTNKGITMGASYNDVKSIMGEADYSYDADDDPGYHSLSYDFETNEYRGDIEFTFDDNKVYEITISVSR